ncbi:sodium-dependent glucose transporter 1 [Alligator mississippiensis]|uniref:Sodium-dependent glucose transporter 1 n=1 Tax=Alligator mississippiensis TaxID=8496 RepID=A0A151MJT9_ALLMI|nr:sodium-dependent glucose transporter 1 [Alligator mississippiensis]
MIQGMSIAVVGPTFQDLARNVNKNVSDIYYIFVGRSVGYLGGSVVGGILFDCMNPHLLLGLSMLGTAAGLYAIPWCKKALMLTGLMSVIGVSMGVLDTGGNVLALNTWGADAGPHMQALHFSFALGAFVAPLLAKMALGSSISQLHNEGAEVSYGSYIFTYAKVYADMKESEAAGLNSIFWGAFAACRGLAICFAACLYPGTMILLSVIGSTVSSLFLVLFATHPVSLWAGSTVYGASMAATFPSGVSWIEQYTTIQGKSAAFFVVGAALGEMCIPAAVGFLQGKFDHLPVIMYAALGASVTTALLFPVMYKLATSSSESMLEDSGESEDRKALLSSSGLDEDEEEEDAEEWNEADFEVIEMNDTMRNSVIETSRKIPESPAKTSNQPPSNNIPFNSPVLAGSSPGRKHCSTDREKND